jgi:hypothetical protein
MAQPAVTTEVSTELSEAGRECQTLREAAIAALKVWRDPKCPDMSDVMQALSYLVDE